MIGLVSDAWRARSEAGVVRVEVERQERLRLPCWRVAEAGMGFGPHGASSENRRLPVGNCVWPFVLVVHFPTQPVTRTIYGVHSAATERLETTPFSCGAVDPGTSPG